MDPETGLWKIPPVETTVAHRTAQSSDGSVLSLAVWPNSQFRMTTLPDNKFHGANMGPTWILSVPDGPHVGPVNLAIRADIHNVKRTFWFYVCAGVVVNTSVSIYWGRVTHICVTKLNVIGSDNGYNDLSPDQRSVIIWMNPGQLSIWPLGTNFSKLYTFIQENAFENVVWKMTAFCLGLSLFNEILNRPDWRHSVQWAGVWVVCRRLQFWYAIY